MKTPLAIALLLAAATGTGLYQHRTLAALRKEAQVIGHSLTERQPSPPQALVKGGTQATPDEAEAAFIAVLNPEPRGGSELELRFLDSIREMDATGIAALIARVKGRGDIPQEIRDRCAGTCIGIMSWGMNAEAIALLQMTPESPERDTLLYQQFSEWSRRRPADAARWFEEERRKGNALDAKLLTDAPDMQHVGILALLRADPDRGIALALSRLPPDVATSTLQNLGSTIATTLADETEHRDYLAALRRAGKQSPDNRLLSEIRSAYIPQLTGQFTGWSCDDAVSLIDSEFTPEEKAQAADRMSHLSDLDEPQKWADWLAKVSWPAEHEHPLGTYIRSWAGEDYIAAGEWLDRYPAGATKDWLVPAYASRICDKFPAEAARRASTLTAGPARTRTLQNIYMMWVDKDEAAATSFAKEHGLEE